MIVRGVMFNLRVDPAAPAENRHRRRQQHEERGAQNPIAAFWPGSALHGNLLFRDQGSEIRGLGTIRCDRLSMLSVSKKPELSHKLLPVSNP